MPLRETRVKQVWFRIVISPTGADDAHGMHDHSYESETTVLKDLYSLSYNKIF